MMPPLHTMKVFLVEDSDLLRERLAHSISELKGIELCGYSDSAKQAVHQIRETEPDVIILDIRLRDGNGFQVLEAVKTRGKLPTVLVLTNFAYPQYRKKFLDAGADYFFDKSNEFPQVISVLKTMLEQDTRAPRKKNKTASRRLQDDSPPTQ